MKSLFIVLILLSPIIIYGQESNLYRIDGKLKVDTMYSINPQRINDLVTIEKYLLPTIYNRLEYPRFASGLSIQGIVIAKIIVTNDSTVSVKIVKSIDESLSKSVIFAIDTAIILNELKDIRKPIEFYLPFKFIVLKDVFRADLESDNSIVIRASSVTSYYERISIHKK
jgi:hypothetical protein